MDLFQSVAVARVVFVLGILNFSLMLLIFLSCRCVPGSRAGRHLMKYGLYKRFFGNHCYLWPALWMSVVVHAVFAIMLLGWPR